MHPLTAAALAALVLAAAGLPVRAQQAPVSPLMARIYDGNWLDPADAVALRDELFYQRAIQVYLRMLPALGVIGLREGSETAFGKGYQVVPVWQERLDGRTWLPGAAPELATALAFLDLRETGPLVVAVPPDLGGAFADAMQRPLVEFGTPGPERPRGGLYLLLPPGYAGQVPAGFEVIAAPTFNLVLMLRTLGAKGAQGPDPAVAAAERLRIRPLGVADKDARPMQFPNASARALDLLYPGDHSWWLKLKAFVDQEPDAALDPELRGLLAAIGIRKGQPFAPTEGERHLLMRALETAPRMILATRQVGRRDGRNRLYADRQWEDPWAGAGAELIAGGQPDPEARAAYFQRALVPTPSQVARTPGVGSRQAETVRDTQGHLLSGSKDYKLHLPADIPAALHWAVTVRNVTDGTLPETRQPLPSLGSDNALKTNGDGSIDLFFGPSRPAAAPETNWIQTVPARDFTVGLHLYGPEPALYDQTWRPDDLVKLN